MIKPFHVICLAGPTGAGKTALSLELARHFSCEIINGDSRQVYRDFPIITAQPTAGEQAIVPHHLYGFLPTEHKISAGEWLRLAEAKIGEIISRKNTPLIVGGTGFYFEALLRGLSAMPEVPEKIGAEFAAQMAEHGSEALHHRLRQIDPDYAARVHPHDRQRIQRALEIFAASGKTFSFWHEQGRLAPIAQGPLLMLNMKLSDLEGRLRQRIELMLEAGAIQEAREALKNCADSATPGFSGIGCREVLACAQGKISLEECKQLWFASTRAYAKRQLTWFRGRSYAIFCNGIEDALAAIARWKEREKL